MQVVQGTSTLTQAQECDSMLHETKMRHVFTAPQAQLCTSAAELSSPGRCKAARWHHVIPR